MLKKWLPVDKLPYHIGLYSRGYASRTFRHGIKVNYDNQKFIYNELVTNNTFLYYIKRYNKKYSYNDAVKPEHARQMRAWVKGSRKWCMNVTNIKKSFSFLQQKQSDSLVPMHANLNYGSAWNNFGKNVQTNIPNHHKKQRYNWFYDTSCVYHKRKNGLHVGSIRFLSRTLVKLPKQPLIRITPVPKYIWNMMCNHDVRIGSVKVAKNNLNHVHLSFQLASDKPFRTLPKTSNKLAQLGYDLNTSNFLMDTDWDNVPNPRYYEREENRFKKLQRCLSRKQRRNKKKHRNLLYCRNYQKNRLELAKVHKHVVHQRINFLQNLSTKLIKSHDLLVGENLKSKNMLKNHRIAKAIQSVGWRMFISMLAYKAKMYHRIFILVSPYDTTQMCDQCGYICHGKTHLTLKDRTWICPNCGAYHVRDVNASVNILQKGYEKLTKYLPAKYWYVRTATNGHKKVLVHGQWLKYLVTHYYGVIDSSRLGDQGLIAYA